MARIKLRKMDRSWTKLVISSGGLKAKNNPQPANINNKPAMVSLAGDKPASDGIESSQINASSASTNVITKYHDQYWDLAGCFTSC
jgi:hypothetical protein